VERRITVVGNKKRLVLEKTRMRAKIRKALLTADDVLFICVHGKGKNKGMCECISGVSPRGGMKIHIATIKWSETSRQDIRKGIMLSLMRGIKK
jgi:hypothetical protein